jgi:hypothetical protein
VAPGFSADFDFFFAAFGFSGAFGFACRFMLTTTSFSPAPIVTVSSLVYSE